MYCELSTHKYIIIENTKWNHNPSPQNNAKCMNTTNWHAYCIIYYNS